MKIAPFVLLVLVIACGTPKVPEVETSQPTPPQTPAEITEESELQEEKEPEIDLGFEGGVSGDLKINSVDSVDSKPTESTAKECGNNGDCTSSKSTEKRICSNNSCKTVKREMPVDYACNAASDCEGKGLPRPKTPGQWSCDNNSCVFNILKIEATPL